MDTTAEEITFDERGRCNFCKEAERAYRKVMSPQNGIIREIVNQIKSKGEYDCLIGLSGGVDSSYTLHLIKQLGLRPLCFTIDNGWNSPNADENIMRLVETLKVPFFRYTIDLNKFRELQGVFMRAGVKNLEIPTDHILMAASLEMASKYGIKIIISGGNVATESIMPESWGYQARDLTHIKDVYKKLTGKKLMGLPVCGLLKWNWYKWIKKIKTVYLLDYVYYNRNEAGNLLSEKYGWKEVGEKHEESDFTKWFQNFYLFQKWGIDKRKAHYSSMIVSGQMTREEAMKRLENNPEYPEFGIEQRVFKYRKHSHYDYKTDEWLFKLISKIIKKLR